MCSASHVERCHTGGGRGDGDGGSYANFGRFVSAYLFAVSGGGEGVGGGVAGFGMGGVRGSGGCGDSGGDQFGRDAFARLGGTVGGVGEAIASGGQCHSECVSLGVLRGAFEVFVSAAKCTGVCERPECCIKDEESGQLEECVGGLEGVGEPSFEERVGEVGCGRVGSGLQGERSERSAREPVQPCWVEEGGVGVEIELPAVVRVESGEESSGSVACGPWRRKSLRGVGERFVGSEEVRRASQRTFRAKGRRGDFVWSDSEGSSVESAVGKNRVRNERRRQFRSENAVLAREYRELIGSGEITRGERIGLGERSSYQIEQERIARLQRDMAIQYGGY
jgi:hypothetical protein